MIGLLLRLYPAGWRTRYGDEFAVMLGERALGPFDVADVLLGAIDAHLNLRGLGAASGQRKGIAMTLRIGGIAALIGGPLWAFSLAGAGMTKDPSPWLVLGMVATVLLLLALIGLSAFQARSHPALVWLAFAIPALGALISIIGSIGMVLFGELRFVLDYSAWYVWFLGTLTMFGGSGLFALATWVSRNLSRAGAALVGLSSLAIFPALGIGGSLPSEVAIALTLLAITAFALGWVALGVSAVRIDRLGGATLHGASA
jgi:hypothetical protein